jgi:peptidoglycan hydrolase-like protein with peptidoglycan-binding domain
MSDPRSPTPYLPGPPQIAEAEALLNTLQEVQGYLKSIDPRSELSQKSQLLTQKLGHKLKQSKQRVQQWSPQPEMYRKQAPARAIEDTRKAEHIQVFTSNLGKPLGVAKASAASPVKSPLTSPAMRLAPIVWVDHGPEVMRLQQFLQSTGQFPALLLDGVYAAETTQAVRQWQREHGLIASGQIDERTRPVLNQHMPYFRVLEQGQKELAVMQVPQALEALFMELARQPFTETARHALNEYIKTHAEQQQAIFFFQSLMSTPGQAYIVHEGTEVAQLQRLLQEDGYDVKPSARFDLNTFMALKAYQQKQGLPPTGQTDAETLGCLNQWVQHSVKVRETVSTLYGLLQKVKAQQAPFVIKTKKEAPQNVPELIKSLQKIEDLLKQHF